MSGSGHYAEALLRQRFMKQGGDNGYTAFNAGLKRQVEDRAMQQNRT